MNLMQHQREAVKVSRQRNRFGFFWQPGTGKTIAILAILEDERQRLGRPLRTLVICPKCVMRAAWLACRLG